MPTTWYPSAFLNGSRPSTKYAIIILNTPINPNAFDAVIKNAHFVVCADGGANALHEYYYGKSKTTTMTNGVHDGKDEAKNSKVLRLPDAIVGDLDSLRPEVEAFFRGKGVDIVKVEEQNSTDFVKCLRWLREQIRLGCTTSSGIDPPPPPPCLDVVTLGGISGRLDQGLSLLHYLYAATADPSLLHGRIYLLSSQSLTFILSAGLNSIHLGSSETFAENVGIIPLSGPTTITTHGLEWDVTDWPTQFGSGMMSTSNHIRSDVVKIEVRGREADAGNLPLFTVELAKRFTAKG